VVETTAAPARLGFLGVGWIGAQRMTALHDAGAATVAAVADLDSDAAEAAAREVDCDTVAADLDALLALELDGIVIATPTGLHAEHVGVALRAGVPVFAQKPLARTEAETRELVVLARERDLRLGVDMSYRHLAATRAALERLHAGAIGAVHAAELTFHNAYGPDKGWARDLALAGGGALLDLGCHLLDLASLFLGRLDPVAVHADLFSGGRRLPPKPREVEDLALAQLTLGGGEAIRLACSWWLSAGTDAVIEATFLGSGGALRIANVGGSFFDFEALEIHGLSSEQLVGPPDNWGPRALLQWARALGQAPGWDPEVERLVDVAGAVDRILGR